MRWDCVSGTVGALYGESLLSRNSPALWAVVFRAAATPGSADLPLLSPSWSRVLCSRAVC